MVTAFHEHSTDLTSENVENHTDVFPLATNISYLLADCGKLIENVVFVGLSPHQHHRPLPASLPTHENSSLGRLWFSSLFTAATLPLTDELCNLVLRYDVLNRAWQKPFMDPESISRQQLQQSCRSARLYLAEADRAWQISVDQSKHLIGLAKARAISLTTWREGNNTADPTNDSQDDFEWQFAAADMTLQTVCSVVPDASLLTSLSNLSASIDSAATPVALLRTATSAWLFGVTSHQSLMSYLQPRFFGLGTQSNNEDRPDIRRARSLITSITQLESHIVLAAQQARIAEHTGMSIVSQWDHFFTSLQVVRQHDFHTSRHDPADDLEYFSGAHNHSASSTVKARTVNLTEWSFVSPDVLIKTLSRTLLWVDSQLRSLYTYEGILWDKGSPAAM